MYNVHLLMCVCVCLCVCVCVCVGEEDQHSLEEFIGKFLKAVESNLCFEFSKYGKIKDLISGKYYCNYRVHIFMYVLVLCIPLLLVGSTIYSC